MTTFLAVVLVLLVGGVVVVAAGRDEGLMPSEDDSPHRQIPTDRDITTQDLAQVRFGTSLWGYRPDEVDALVARLLAERVRAEGGTAAE